MSADAYGARLLAEVHEESLASLLSTFWLQYDPDPDPSVITGFPRLDTLIDRLQPRMIRDAQSAHRTEFADVSSDEEPDIDAAVRQPQVNVQHEKRKPITLHVSNYFNVQPLASTALLHKLLSSSVLPTDVGGKGGIGVYIDCTESFEPGLLYELVASHLTKFKELKADGASSESGVAPEAEKPPHPPVDEHQEHNVDGGATGCCGRNAEQGDSEEGKGDEEKDGNSAAVAEFKAPELDPQEMIAKLALQHVHVFQCNSSISILGTLRQLPEYLMRVSAHHSGERLLRFVCIYGIDNFYWMERQASDMARLEGGQATTNASRTEVLSSQILKELKTLQARFDCPLAAYTTIQTPGPDDAHAEETLQDERSDITPTFNNYAHSALLTLYPFQKPFTSTIPRSSEDIFGWKYQQTNVLHNREYRFRPYLGGAATLEDRVDIDQQALKELDLHMALDIDNHFVFDM